MKMFNSVKTPLRWATAWLLLSAALTVPALAQNADAVADMKLKVGRLVEQTKFYEALPLLEKIVAAEPDNAVMQVNLGFAYIAHSRVAKKPADRKAFLIKGRAALVKAKELGRDDALINAMIRSIPADGSEALYSEDPEVQKLMVDAEAAFSKGDMGEALNKYQKALKLDPLNYNAALFSGDVYLQREDWSQAETWYQRAIAIDPTRETAYRYSATPFMKQKKYAEARDRYLEAYIVEPYGQYSISGIKQWASATHATLAHPNIEIPTEVSYDANGKINITLDASLLLGGKDDGSSAWIIYGVTRKRWHDETFAKTFPDETAYRHSLAEEADALRAVVRLASEDPKVKNLSPALKKLKKLIDQGLLEAYILLARPDRGIAQDHADYLQTNRDLLRRYAVEYVITGGGGD